MINIRIALIVFCIFAPVSLHAQSVKFIDGDTIFIDGKKHRLANIDAPEIKQKCEHNFKAWNCGKAAKANLQRIIAKRKIQCIDDSKDRYGRTLSTCFAISSKGNAVNLNERMVQRGWAINYRHQKVYLSSEQSAKKEKLGVWRGTFVYPWQWRASDRG